MSGARTEILKWAQNRSGGQFPLSAKDGQGFEHLVAGRSTSAVKIDRPEIYAWALRQDDPDKQIPGRVWTSEVILWRKPDETPRFAARLIVGSREAELDIVPAAPGYVRQIVERIGVSSGGRLLSWCPWFIEDVKAEDALIDYFSAPSRSLPVIVISITDTSHGNYSKLAELLCGLAEVVVIRPKTSWAITQRFGKRLSVYECAIRIFMPGFNEDADPFGHPLWLGERLRTPEGAALVDRKIRARVAQFSTRSVRLGVDILPFAQLRSLALQPEQDRLEGSNASASEKLSAAENRIVAISKELKQARDIEQYALEEAAKADSRAEEAERREFYATAQVQMLLQQLFTAEVVGSDAQAPPKSWVEFADWCDTALVGRVVLTAAAKRGCKKALYADVEQAARCLLWLARECRDRFLHGGGSLRDETIEGQIRISPCGGDKFTFDWRGGRLNADWHVKTGGNTRNPEYCLRIYFGWDEQTHQIIIADMPAHRESGAS